MDVGRDSVPGPLHRLLHADTTLQVQSVGLAPCPLPCFHIPDTCSHPAKVCRADALPEVGTVALTLGATLSSSVKWWWCGEAT